MKIRLIRAGFLTIDKFREEIVHEAIPFFGVVFLAVLFQFGAAFGAAARLKIAILAFCLISIG